MKEILKQIENWYLINCNGDWEHSFGFSIGTLDNPGWTINIDLEDTSLSDLDFEKNYQNPDYEHDWYFIKTDKKVLTIDCGPKNLSDAIRVFFDEIIPQFSDPNFLYDIYLELQGVNKKIWTPVKARLIDESTFELVNIPELNLKESKVEKIEDFNDIDHVMEKLKHDFRIGDKVTTSLIDVYDGMIQVAEKKRC